MDTGQKTTARQGHHIPQNHAHHTVTQSQTHTSHSHTHVPSHLDSLITFFLDHDHWNPDRSAPEKGSGYRSAATHQPLVPFFSQDREAGESQDGRERGREGEGESGVGAAQLSSRKHHYSVELPPDCLFSSHHSPPPPPSSTSSSCFAHASSSSLFPSCSPSQTLCRVSHLLIAATRWLPPLLLLCY